MKREKKYYVYALLNPSKEWKGYDKYRIKYEPFYIGKGSGSRAEMHYKNFANKQISHNSKLLAELTILDSKGIVPLTKIIYRNLTEEEAYEKESELILHYKFRYKDGVLVNRSSGKAGGWGGDINPTFQRMELGTHNFQVQNPQQDTEKTRKLKKLLMSGIKSGGFRIVKSNDPWIESSGYSSAKSLILGLNRLIHRDSLPYIIKGRIIYHTSNKKLRE